MDQKTQELIQTDISFSRLSEQEGAAKAFAAYLTKDALQLPNHNKHINGLINIVKAMEGDYTLSWIPRGGKVANSEDMGFTWGFYEMKFKNAAGQLEIEKGKYLNIGVKETNGTWKVLVDMGNMS